MNKRGKRKYILRGAKYTFFIALISGCILSILALIYSFLKPSPIIKNIYTTLYYFGAFSLLIAVPQLYKRNEDSKNRKIRRLSPIYGFYDFFENKYTDDAMMESFEEFKGEGFWDGIFIVLFAVILFVIAFLLENLYFYIGM